MPMWLQIVIGVATGMAAMSVVWWRIVVPVARLSDATPILVEIASQFRPNDGHSLHDRVVRIERTGEHLEAELAGLQRQLSDVQRTLERLMIEGIRPGWPVGEDPEGTPI